MQPSGKPQEHDLTASRPHDLTAVGSALRLTRPAGDIGESIYALAAELYPICRSITGNGVRTTLRKLLRHIDIEVHEVPTGTPAFDWTVPREWNIRDAYVKDGSGRKIIDLASSNLHVMSYSVPVRARMGLAELRPHLHSLPEQPDLIPYRTSYYAESWGFCLPHRQLVALTEDTYEVVIDSILEDGYLTYGEHLHRGETDAEVLLSAHICHPSLANDNCSGLALLTHLAERLKGVRTRYSYRFIFAPGSIGALVWLARNEDKIHRIRHGLVLSCVGDGGGPTYKRSRRGDAEIDRAMAHVLRHCGHAPTLLDFSPYGYDERQYCSPGFDLPVGLFQRSRFGAFPEYHTSADNLAFIAPEHLEQSYRMVAGLIEVLEDNRAWRSTSPKGEPQLGRRGLYGSIGGDRNAAAGNMALLWVLNQSDGRHTLLDIAERAALPFPVIRDAAAALLRHGLLEPIGVSGQPQADAAGANS
jgi:aminopeptidase-like protein